MKRRECLTILGAVIAGPLLIPAARARHAVEFDGLTDRLERYTDMTGLTDSKTGVMSFWFSDSKYFDLSTAEGRIAALNACKEGRLRRGRRKRIDG